MGLDSTGHYVACVACGCCLKMNGTCTICGHIDEEEPPPPPPEP